MKRSQLHKSSYDESVSLRVQSAFGGPQTNKASSMRSYNYHGNPENAFQLTTSIHIIRYLMSLYRSLGSHRRTDLYEG